MRERVLLEVRGVVQGVGFRPFVHTLATSLDLKGFVQNLGAHVLIDVEGDRSAVAAFRARLAAAAPPRAAVESITQRAAPPADHQAFLIRASGAAGDSDVRIAADVATCDACLAELFDPANRRFRYPFTTCSWCGPRYTIATGVPYDRSRTTMAGFAMCAECRHEYEDPANRRFHAEPIACPRCGPALSTGRGIRGDAALEEAAAALRAGLIVAAKGLGGYHLACDAADEAAVARLRERKGREAKPLAIMLPADAARALQDAAVFDALMLPERPIVLVDRAQWADAGLPPLAPNVAAGCPAVGVMLPYTPLHHLLLRDAGRPLVMTSGNRSDEPIAFEDADARTRLAGIADIFLSHDRPIHARCDDSIVAIAAGAPSLVRRARGYAPGVLTLAEATPEPVLAVGGHLKNTFCILDGAHACLSPHIGDLEHVSAYEALRAGVRHYERLLGAAPAIVAHDLHPEYLSTRAAGERSGRAAGVQHHHAHVLSCAAEHGVTEPVIGVAFDGAGLGTDGAVWGGEFLVLEGTTCRRAAHLKYVAQPGGDRAAREPWRMAVAHASAAGAAMDGIAARVPPAALGAVTQMSAGAARAPLTSSIGRLFDAVASLARVRDRCAFEGQAAMELEALAAGATARRYAFDVATSCEVWTVDPAPVIRAVVRDVEDGVATFVVASAFHEALAAMVSDVAARLASATGIRRVALTGGVFQNVRLTELTARALTGAGLDVLLHRRVPCNDGGLALGQAVAVARLLRAGTLEGYQICA